MRILLIGGTGFLGTHLIHALQDHSLTVFHRGRTKTTLSGVQHIFGERSNISEYRTPIQQFDPDLVIDVTPYTQLQAEKVTDVFRGICKKFVVISSADVYRNYNGWRGKTDAPPEKVPLSEDAPLRTQLYPYKNTTLDQPDWIEKYDKILVERVYQNSDICSSVICRLPKLYGEGDTQHHLLPALRRMWDQRPYIVLPETLADWKWSRCYAGNISQMVTSIIRADTFEPAVYNLGPGHALCEKNWLSSLADVTNWKGEIRTASQNVIPDTGTAYHWGYDLELDTSRFWQRFPETQILPLEASLEKSIHWEKKNAAGQSSSYYLDYNIEDIIMKRQES